MFFTGLTKCSNIGCILRRKKKSERVLWKNNVYECQDQGDRMRGKREKAAELMGVASDNETFV